MPGNDTIVDLVGFDPTCLDLVCDCTHRIDDFGTSAVIEREREGELAVLARHLLGLGHALAHPPRNATATAPDETDAHAELLELFTSPEKQRLIEIHEEAHFLQRTAPVLRGEGVDGQPLDTQFERAMNRIEQGRLACSVTVGSPQSLPLRPPAIAIHDDGHMPGNPVTIDR